MKKINIFTFLCALFILYFFALPVLETLCGCSMGNPGTGLMTSCSIKSLEPIFIFLEWIFLAFVWFTPMVYLAGLCLSFVSFQEDYKKIKAENKNFSYVFKKFSFYLGLFFSILSLIVLYVLIKSQISVFTSLTI